MKITPDNIGDFESEAKREKRFANNAAMIASFDLGWYLKHKHCPQTGAKCKDVRKSCVTFCWLK